MPFRVCLWQVYKSHVVTSPLNVSRPVSPLFRRMRTSADPARGRPASPVSVWVGERRWLSHWFSPRYHRGPGSPCHRAFTQSRSTTTYTLIATDIESVRAIAMVSISSVRRRLRCRTKPAGDPQTACVIAGLTISGTTHDERRSMAGTTEPRLSDAGLMRACRVSQL